MNTIARLLLEKRLLADEIQEKLNPYIPLWSTLVHFVLFFEDDFAVKTVCLGILEKG